MISLTPFCRENEIGRGFSEGVKGRGLDGTWRLGAGDRGWGKGKGSRRDGQGVVGHQISVPDDEKAYEQAKHRAKLTQKLWRHLLVIFKLLL